MPSEISSAGSRERNAPAAFCGGAVIGALGGLIGIGGAEFRLPLLIGAFRFAALQSRYSQQSHEPRHRRLGFTVPRGGCPFRQRALADHREPARRQPARRVVRRELGDAPCVKTLRWSASGAPSFSLPHS
jgi:hypothetical protein